MRHGDDGDDVGGAGDDGDDGDGPGDDVGGQCPKRSDIRMSVYGVEQMFPMVVGSQNRMNVNACWSISHVPCMLICFMVQYVKYIICQVYYTASTLYVKYIICQVRLTHDSGIQFRLVSHVKSGQDRAKSGKVCGRVDTGHSAQ